MKTIKSITRKIVVTVAALLLFTAAQARAGSVTLTGAIEQIDDADFSHVTLDTPVVLELTWAEGLVNAVGESTVDFHADWGNTMTLAVGPFTLKENTPSSQTTIPYAHFTDGVLDEFVLDKWNVQLPGTNGHSWWITVQGYAGDANIFWDIEDMDFSGDWISGYIDFPAPAASPVPVPGAVWLLASGLLGLGGLRRKLR